MGRPFQVWEEVYAVGDGDLSHPFDCSIYLVDFGELVLIDSGAGKSFDRLVSNIETLGFDPRKLTTILATHAHIDHIGSLHEFQREFGARVIAHELDARGIEEGRGIAAEAYGVLYTPCRVDVIIHGSQEVLVFGDHELNVIHIPGHTPGSIAAYLDTAGRRVLFGQDVHGPYYPAWGADPAKARTSLQKLVELKADILCEGHFGIYEPASAVEEYIQGYIDML